MNKFSKLSILSLVIVSLAACGNNAHQTNKVFGSNTHHLNNAKAHSVSIKAHKKENMEKNKVFGSNTHHMNDVKNSNHKIVPLEKTRILGSNTHHIH